MKNALIKFVFVMATLFTGSVFAHHLTVSDAVVRALPPGVPNTAAYMTITNHSDKAIKLLSANTDIAAKVELHEHQHQDGVMKMRQVMEIDVPANGNVALQPGGYHVMLFGLKKPIKAGQQIAIALSFSDGSEFTVNAGAVKPGQEQQHHHHH